MKRIIILVMSLALPSWAAGAASNPWIYESGKGRFHYAQYDYGFDHHFGRKGHRDRASNPQGHWPLPGKCRAWFLSRVPGC
jgi:opacity protein-like surface antigen